MTAHDDLAILRDPRGWRADTIRAAADRVAERLAEQEAALGVAERLASGVTTHDDLATLREVLAFRSVHNAIGTKRKTRAEAALSRVEAELARLEANERHLTNLHDWRAKGEQEQKQRAVAAEDALQAKCNELVDLVFEKDEAEQREARLREGLRRIVNVLGPDYFSGELEGLLAEGHEALNIARALLDKRAAEAAVGPAPTEPGASHASESSAAARSLLADNQEASEPCGSFGCVLPRGHNRGRADIPENHLPAEPTTEQP